METTANNNAQGLIEEMHQVMCNGCQATSIYSDRYKCLQCDNYNLCGVCFEEGRSSKRHSTGHVVAHFRIPNELFGQILKDSDVTLNKLKQHFADVSHSASCNVCKKEIVGLRLKCDKCYDYNLCLNCFQHRLVNNTHTNEHPMILGNSVKLLKISSSDIHLKRLLGRGGFGQVHSATWLSKNRDVACKKSTVFKHDQHLEDAFRQELATYAELSGIFILKTFCYSERQYRDGSKDFYLLMEFMNRGSLQDVIENTREKLSLRRKLNMAYHIGMGMHKLHMHGLIHRDIRPDNILISSNYTAKIGDMGISKVFSPGERHTLAGCLPFMPPEFYSGQYDQSLDVFTYGLTVNQLFTEQFHNFNKSDHRITITTKSPVFSKLITRCVIGEPHDRPSSAEIVTALRDFKYALDKHIDEEYPDYRTLTTSAKNEIIIHFYNNYQKIEKKDATEKHTPAPVPRRIKDLSDQYFANVMREFEIFKNIRSIHEENNVPVRFMKILKRYISRDVERPIRQQEFANVDIQKGEQRRVLSPKIEANNVHDKFFQERDKNLKQDALRKFNDFQQRARDMFEKIEQRIPSASKKPTDQMSPNQHEAVRQAILDRHAHRRAVIMREFKEKQGSFEWHG